MPVSNPMTEMERYLVVERGLLPMTWEKYGVKPNGKDISIPIGNIAKVYTPGGTPKIKWSAPVQQGEIIPPFPSYEGLRASRLIVEGEFDAMVASQELGYDVASSSAGAMTWKDEWTDAVTGQPFTILYDNDEPGRKGSLLVAERLRKAGCPVRIAHWPLDKPKGYDITEHFKAGVDHDKAVEELKAVLEAAEEYFPAGMSMSVGDFSRMEIAKQTMLIDSVWPDKAIGFIAGPPKSFKSFIALELAFSIASGKPFLLKYAVPRQGRVLLIQQESSLPAFQARIANMMLKYGKAPGLYIISNKSMSLENETDIERLEDEIQRIKPDLVVLDPLASFVQGDENSSQEMGNIIRTVRRLRDDNGAGFCIVHHSNKETKKATGERSGLRMRGSSAFYAAAEAGIWVERTEDEGALKSRIRVELKESEAPAPFHVWLDPENCSLEITDEYTTHKPVVQTEYEQSHWGPLDIMEDH